MNFDPKIYFLTILFILIHECFGAPSVFAQANTPAPHTDPSPGAEFLAQAPRSSSQMVVLHRRCFVPGSVC